MTRFSSSTVGEVMLTEKELAELLGLSRITLRKWRCAGIGPQWARLSARAIRYPRSAVDDFIGERMNKRTATGN